MAPSDLRALAARVEAEEPSDELTAQVLTAFGCESEPGSAPEPLTRVDDAMTFQLRQWHYAARQPIDLSGAWIGNGMRRGQFPPAMVISKAPTEARARTAANLRAKAWEARNA